MYFHVLRYTFLLSSFPSLSLSLWISPGKLNLFFPFISFLCSHPNLPLEFLFSQTIFYSFHIVFLFLFLHFQPALSIVYISKLNCIHIFCVWWKYFLSINLCTYKTCCCYNTSHPFFLHIARASSYCLKSIDWRLFAFKIKAGFFFKDLKSVL